MEKLINLFKMLSQKEQIETLNKLWNLVREDSRDFIKTEPASCSYNSKGQADSGTGQPSCNCAG